MNGFDGRLVQTAVIGGRNSGRAIILPTDADELTRWRRRHPAYTYWCGTQLGGCGNELSDRLYRDKVCHFAHRPHTSCHRTATGAASADHLFIKDDLAAWAGRSRLKGRTTSRNLGSGPGDAVDFRTGAARQHVRFQFSRLAHAEWHRTRRRLAGDSVTLDWVFGPGAAHSETMEELYDEYGYLYRFRFATHGAVRRIRLRAEDPRRSTDWVPLDACAMTPEGLWIPGVEPRPRSRTGSAAEAGARSEPAPARRSREEQVLALKDALLSAARLRTRPTWEALARTVGSDLLALSLPDRVGLLDAVEQTGREGSPLLSALIRTAEGDPPAYVGEVVAAVGCGSPATAAVLKRWCQREADRAFAVHGVPARMAPPRLPLTPDGHLVVQQSAEPAQHQTIVHVTGGPVRRSAAVRPTSDARAISGVPLYRDTEIRHALRAARRGRTPKRAAALMARAAEALTRLPEPQRTQLVTEMATTRSWLDSSTDGLKRKPKPKPRQSPRAKAAPDAKKTAAAKQSTRAKKTRRGEKAGDPLQGARGLPGVGDVQPQRKPRKRREKKPK
ncbi:competence protein CoiA family protein [Streptomyces sp. SGAir0957]